MLKNINKKRGFTLIEVLVVIAIIAILAAIVIVAINPAKRFQDARMTQRQANVESILSAIQQNMVDNKGIFKCNGVETEISATLKHMGAGASAVADSFDIAPCLTSYLAVLPVDPQTGKWNGPTDYKTGYTIEKLSTGQITISAPAAENEDDDNPQPGYPISVTR